MKKRTGALLMALVMIFGLMAPAASAVETGTAVEAVYLGVKDYGTVTSSEKENFVHRFFVDGEEMEYTVATGKNEKYAIQNELMEGYIYNITVADDVVTDVELQDKGVIKMGAVADMAEEDLNGKPVYEITTQAGGATVTEIEFADIELDDTVKITANAVYKAFVADEYVPPVAGTPGEKTLKNFLTTALQPVGTALYVYGGCWDWQDSDSSNQAMTIGIPQSWIDFFQQQDESYTYKNSADKAHSYYPHNSWNQYYYAGVDCSAYTGWAIYNTLNTESSTVENNENGYVDSSTKQAKNLANKGWGKLDQGNVSADGVHTYNGRAFNVGDIFSMNGHVWICLGTCEDGSIVFMHSTPSENNGAGIQISAIGPDKDCLAYQLADHYMETYYPVWGERYDALLKSFDGYTITTGSNAGKFSWYLDEGKGILTDPDGYADKTPTEILGEIYNDEFVPTLKFDTDVTAEGEAVYLGLRDFTYWTTEVNVDNPESYFVHRFFMNDEEIEVQVAFDEDYTIQNTLMEGYIYNITVEDGVVTAATLQDKGTITMGTIESMGEGSTIVVDGEEIACDGKAAYEITTTAGGATVAKAEVAVGDTVEITGNAVYKAFVAEEYTAPVEGTPGVTTLKNFLTTALQPVGTALYVYGGAWDWQDDVSSNQSMTIGIPQSWIDFFQSQDEDYHYKQINDNGSWVTSYYTSNRGWNQYYYAGVDCSAYTGWIIYNITNTKDSTDNDDGHVGSSTKQAKTLAGYKWGTWDHDTANHEFQVGDIVSMSGHVWVVLGVCDDGSIVFMHSTPSESVSGSDGGGIQIASLDPNGGDGKDCEAYALANYYMNKYYPQWTERYNVAPKSYSSYAATSSNSNAGVFSWYLNGEETALLSDPEGYANMTPAEILADIFGEENADVVTEEAIYLGVKDYGSANGRNKDNFQYRFWVNGEEKIYTIQKDSTYTIQNKLQNGYIYNIITVGDMICAVDSADESVVAKGKVTAVGENTVTVDGSTYTVDKLWEIESPVAASGAVVKAAEAVTVGETVKVTDNAVYKAFVAEEYEPPVAGTPGEKTLKNFLTTALTPVGTALYVYGGAWDWQDDVSSNQTMTIGIPQSWIDFYQSQDENYTYRQRVVDENGNLVKDAAGDYIDDLENSYYWRRYNEFYWAGVDCSAYVGWVVYNTMNTESATVDEDSGYVGSATAQAKRFAVTEDWGTFDIGHYQMNEDGTYYADGDGDCRRYFNSEDFKVGDVFSDNGHVWIVIGKCDDGSIVFTHSTPSASRNGTTYGGGGGIQLAALDPDNDPECEAVKLAEYYNEKYFSDWNERYGTDQKDWGVYTKVYDSGVPTDEDYSMTAAGKFSWNLGKGGVLTDKEGYADMSAAEILMDIFGDDGIPAGSSSKPAINKDAEASEPSTEVEETTTYTDVPETHWAYEAIEAVSEAGLFNGTSATTFSPEAATTRGQLMTVLARLSGEKAATIAEGVAWAVENGISDGTAADAQITREQLVTMLYRYAQLKGIDVSVGENTNILSYTDAEAISEYAVSAMQWACGAGIINGMTADTLAPAGTATRAQIATIMQRYAGL